ncbi:MAG TPA: hypothetical protein VGC19_15380 [Rhodanobacter sp.]
MKIKNLALALLVFFANPVNAQNDSNLFRATWNTDTAIYKAEINNVSSKDPNSSFRKIHIWCSSGCDKKASYEEKTLDDPLYVMRSTDESDQVVTVWTTGASYKVVIYQIGKVISKVFESGSKDPPVASYTSSGNEVLTLCENGVCRKYESTSGAYKLVK